jgi:hypothetical protein
MAATKKLETMTFERKIVDKITVTSESIKDPSVLADVIESKCDVVTKLPKKRPFIYLKNPGTLQTIGGVRMNKNSIATFYLDTKKGEPINSIGVVSKENDNSISNRIIVNDFDGLNKVFDLINKLIEEDKFFSGK